MRKFVKHFFTGPITANDWYIAAGVCALLSITFLCHHVRGLELAYACLGLMCDVIAEIKSAPVIKDL